MGITIGIIGGGASGMMAAIIAAKTGAQVTILEGNDRLGKKILATGNGKCNLGNEKLDLEEYYTESPAILKNCLERFNTKDTIAFFKRLGLLTKSKNGYLYPLSEQAAAVLDVLRFAVEESGVHIEKECKIKRVERDKKSGKYRLISGEKSLTFDRVIIACGGMAAAKTGSDGSGFELAKQLGHNILPTVPALVQLRCKEDFFKAVSGVRAEAVIKIIKSGKVIASERGELQLTDYGISGIPVFQVSRIVNYILLKEKEVEVQIDFLPDYTREAFAEMMIGRKALSGKRTVEEFFTGVLNKKLMLLFVKLAGLKPGDNAGKVDVKKLEKVYALCKNWTVHVIGHNGFDNAQVCAGGVPLEEVTLQMESKKAPGVFFAGEILDVDGKCGGYNLQWAWCSGFLAGSVAAKR